MTSTIIMCGLNQIYIQTHIGNFEHTVKAELSKPNKNLLCNLAEVNFKDLKNPFLTYWKMNMALLAH